MLDRTNVSIGHKKRRKFAERQGKYLRRLTGTSENHANVSVISQFRGDGTTCKDLDHKGRQLMSGQTKGLTKV